MSHFVSTRFSHVRPARPAAFFSDSEFSDTVEQRLAQEDRLIAIGLLICFVVQAAVLLW